MELEAIQNRIAELEAGKAALIKHAGDLESQRDERRSRRIEPACLHDPGPNGRARRVQRTRSRPRPLFARKRWSNCK